MVLLRVALSYSPKKPLAELQTYIIKECRIQQLNSCYIIADIESNLEFTQTQYSWMQCKLWPASSQTESYLTRLTFVSSTWYTCQINVEDKSGIVLHPIKAHYPVLSSCVLWEPLASTAHWASSKHNFHLYIMQSAGPKLNLECTFIGGSDFQVGNRESWHE